MNFSVTSPLMGTKNKEVAKHITALQHLLISKGFLKGPADGIYGTTTAQAVYRAKYHLGYPHPDHSAGDLLYGYLGGARVPARYKAYAATRAHEAAKKAAETPMREKALQFLIDHNGMKESPAGTNRCAVTEWYDLIGPWCAMTGVWAYSHVGSKVFTLENAHRHNWAYVPNILSDSRRGINGLTATHSPLPGNGVCYKWPGVSNATADHYGTFEKWIEVGKTFYAREGNTGIGNDSNGGELMQRERNVGNVAGFVVIGG